MTQEAFEKWFATVDEHIEPEVTARQAWQAATAQYKEVMEEVREAVKNAKRLIDLKLGVPPFEIHMAEHRLNTAITKLTALLDKE